MDYQQGLPPPVRRSHRALVIAVLLLAVIVLAGRHCWRRPFHSTGLSGHFMNAVAVPGPAGGHRVWILSDGSFHYIKKVERPGYISMGRKCKFCKTWTYVYDPVKPAVLAKFKTDYRSIITQSWMAGVDGKIWVATDAYEDNPPRLFIYRAEPPALVRETPEIIKTYPELSSGLIHVRMERNPDRLILDTKDGRVGLVLALRDEKLYENDRVFKQASAAGEEEDRISVFALSSPDGSPRKTLFRVSGPRGRVKESRLESMLSHGQSVPSAFQATLEPQAPGCVYIEGMIFYQDADGCLILHQDAAGNQAHRLLTRVDANGNEQWTAGPAELFKEMDVDLDKDSTSAIFFVKTELAVSRSGSLVLLQQKGVGAIGFDFATGKKLWEIRP